MDNFENLFLFLILFSCIDLKDSRAEEDVDLRSHEGSGEETESEDGEDGSEHGDETESEDEEGESGQEDEHEEEEEVRQEQEKTHG